MLFWRQSREQNFMFKALVHAGRHRLRLPRLRQGAGQPRATGRSCSPSPASASASRPPARGQKIEHDFREARQEAKPAPTRLPASHRLAGGGLWLLKLVLDQAQDRRARQVPRRGDVDGHPGRQHDQRLGRQVRRDRARTPTSACSTTCCSGRTAQLVTVWPEEFTTQPGEVDAARAVESA